MNTLIVGYGSAGKRHARLLKPLTPSMEITAVDPIVTGPDVQYGDIKDALSAKGYYQLAVIASPPDWHLTHIKMCLDAGVKAILCEKPLCGFGQIKEAKQLVSAPVMVAYNYRFHPEIIRGLTLKRLYADQWVCLSDSYSAQLPEWGQLLDRLGHTFDSLSLLAGNLIVKKASWITSVLNDGCRTGEVIIVEGQTASGGGFRILDCVRKQPQDKKAYIAGPIGKLDMCGIGDMFEKMWASFFSTWHKKEPFSPNIKDALVAQSLLEETNRIIVKKEINVCIPALS